MITASHNPPEYNGLKISRSNAVPVGYAEGLSELEGMIHGEISASSPKGTLRNLDIQRQYVGHVETFKRHIESLKIVIDCSDGMAGVYIHDIIRNLNAEVTLLYDVPNGSFPHHDPNPLNVKNLRDLQKKVAETGADIGICFDGDADRVVFVDERGSFISPDLITALLGYHFFVHNPQLSEGHETVLYDVRSSRSVVECIEKFGGKPRMCRVGHSFAKKLLRETDGSNGGELAGHYYFRDNYYCDSGIIAALQVLSVISQERKPISTLISRIHTHFYSGEINFEIQNKDRIVRLVQDEYRDGTTTDIDGIRIDFPTWWFNLRPSNTEPYLRLVVEADTAVELDARLTELKQKIEDIASTVG